MRTILVIEDELEIRDMMQLALEEAGGYSVLSARGFDAAGQMLEDERPDLLILDAVVPASTAFPGRSAMEFAAYALARDVPIILMTGYVELADAIEALQFPLLRKPFGIDELRRAVEGATRRPRENLRRVRDALDYLLHNRDTFASLLERLGRLGDEAVPPAGTARRPNGD